MCPKSEIYTDETTNGTKMSDHIKTEQYNRRISEEIKIIYGIIYKITNYKHWKKKLFLFLEHLKNFEKEVYNHSNIKMQF